MNLDKITEAVKMGSRWRAARRSWCRRSQSATGSRWTYRDEIFSCDQRPDQDSTEALAMAHQFDGLVMIPNCDKNVPGLLMAVDA